MVPEDGIHIGIVHLEANLLVCFVCAKAYY